MEKEFLPYDLALKLREIGFKEKCIATIDQVSYIHIKGTRQPIRGAMCYNTIICPTISQVFRWFRDEYRMFHEVFIDTEPSVENPNKLEFSYLILHMVGAEHMYVDKEKSKRFNTYEEAELACLDRVIEVIEEKQIKPYEDVVS